MNVGQRVMLIANYGLISATFAPPPLGAVGEITEPLDRYGDYFVLFDDYPCPVGDEPEWYVPHWALIPIDDQEDLSESVPYGVTAVQSHG